MGGTWAWLQNREQMGDVWSWVPSLKTMKEVVDGRAVPPALKIVNAPNACSSLPLSIWYMKIFLLTELTSSLKDYGSLTIYGGLPSAKNSLRAGRVVQPCSVFENKKTSRR